MTKMAGYPACADGCPPLHVPVHPLAPHVAMRRWPLKTSLSSGATGFVGAASYRSASSSAFSKGVSSPSATSGGRCLVTKTSEITAAKINAPRLHQNAML